MNYYFSLFEIINQEFELYDTLELLDVPLDRIKELMTVEIPSQVDYRLNLRSDKILWVNNLEKDPVYARWPESLFEVCTKKLFCKNS